MRVAVAVVLMLAGCDRLFELDYIYPIADAPPINGDVFGRPVDASECVGGGTPYGMYGPNGSGLFRVCLSGPIPPVAALPTPIQTGQDQYCMQIAKIDTIGTELCVIYAQNITIASNIGTNGPRPLVLVATQALTIDAQLNVAANAGNGSLGAGSNFAGCGVANGGTGGGGAAGGSNGSHGGNGGMGGSALGVGPASTIPLDRVRGGCPGGRGGNGGPIATDAPGGVGGGGGGAVYLIAGMRLDLGPLAVINASGAGGHGGGAGVQSGSGLTNGGGGGGGGAGGLIGLDSPNIVISPNAKLLANGGGGGAGGAPLTTGQPGQDPSSGAVAVQALGGMETAYNMQVLGGAGGRGFALAGNATGGAPNKAGGGGGGGAGYIAIYSTVPALPSPNMSPAPTF